MTSIARLLTSAVPLRVAGVPPPGATSACSRIVQVVAAHHFPTQYRLSFIRTLSHRLDAAGFGSVDSAAGPGTGRSH